VTENDLDRRQELLDAFNDNLTKSATGLHALIFDDITWHRMKLTTTTNYDCLLDDLFVRQLFNAHIIVGLPSASATGMKVDGVHGFGLLKMHGTMRNPAYIWTRDNVLEDCRPSSVDSMSNIRIAVGNPSTVTAFILLPCVDRVLS